jgi:hypothetical protein
MGQIEYVNTGIQSTNQYIRKTLFGKDVRFYLNEQKYRLVPQEMIQVVICL